MIIFKFLHNTKPKKVPNNKSSKILTYDPFYALNTILLFLISFYTLGTILTGGSGLFSKVFSQEETEETTNKGSLPSPTKIELILTALDVNFSSRTKEKVCFDQTFRSDGKSGNSLTPEDKERFDLSQQVQVDASLIENEEIRNALSKNTNNTNSNKLPPIDLKTEICVNRAKMTNVGEIKFNKIRKVSAPPTFKCDESKLDISTSEPNDGATYQKLVDERKQQLQNCLFNGVMLYALLESGSSKDVLVTEAEIQDELNSTKSAEIVGEQEVIKSTTNLFTSFLESIFGPRTVLAGSADTQDVVGTVNFISKDEFGVNSLNNTDFSSTLEVKIDSLGAILNVSSINNEFSPSSLTSNQTGNIGDPQSSRNISTLESTRGIGSIPGERIVGENKDEGNASLNQTNPLYLLFERLSQNIFSTPKEGTKNDILNPSKGPRLAPHNPVRAIGDTNNFSAEYDFCKATENLNVPIPQTLRNKLQNELTYLRDTLEQISNNTSPNLPPINIDAPKYRCLQRFMVYSENNSVIGSSLENCALSLIGGSENCQEFSVKEDKLTFDFAEKSIPAGLSSYSVNNTYNLYTANDSTGPFVNPLSIYGCSKLSVVYDISKANGQNYIKSFTSSQNNFATGSKGSQPISEYCVVGSLFGNLSWVFLNFSNNFSSTSEIGNPNRQFPREALTCDKKNETVEFGAEPVWTDIGSANIGFNPSNELFGPFSEIIYISRDQNYGYFSPTEGNDTKGTKELLQTSEDVTLNVGGSRYRFTFLDEIKKPIYGDNIRILFGSDEVPRFAYFTAIERKENEETKFPTYLCKIPQQPSNSSSSNTRSTDSATTIRQQNCIQIKSNQPEAGYGSFVEANNGRIVLTILEKNVENNNQTVLKRCLLKTDIIDPNSANTPIKEVGSISDLKDNTCIVNPVKELSPNLPEDSYYGLKNMVRIGGNFTFLINNEFYISPNAGTKESLDVRLITAVTALDEEGRINQSALDVSGNLCSDISEEGNSTNTQSSRRSNYCNYIATNGFVSTYLKKSPDGALHAVLSGSGIGLIWERFPNITQAHTREPRVFGYKQFTEGFSLNRENFYDEISFFNVDNAGGFHLFFGKSAYYLYLQPTNLIFGPKVEYACTNCLITRQYSYNPINFDSDCTDYLGKGVCGYPKMEKLGLPEVFYVKKIGFGVTGNARNPYIRPQMTACYTLPGLSKSIMCSEYGYSLTGVYSKADPSLNLNSQEGEGSDIYRIMPLYTRNSFDSETENNSVTTSNISENKDKKDPIDNEENLPTGGGLNKVEDGVEYSNVYSVTQFSLESKEFQGLAVLGSSAGFEGNLRTGRGLIVLDDGTPDGVVRENFNITNPDRAECKRKIELVVSKDIFFDITGAKQINLNPSKVSGGSSSTNSNSGFTGQNAGQFCEQTWCFQGDPDLVFNPDFAKDSTDETLLTQLTNYVNSRSSLGANSYEYVRKICAKSDTKQIPCELLIGIWGAESGFATHGTAFGCFADGYLINFDTQLECAVNLSLGSEGGGIKYKNWQENRTQTVLSGNGSIFTHPNGNLDKSEDQKRGSCNPGTGFSYISNRYTPNDKRIDIENQCNRGVVERTDHGQYCTGDVHTIVGGGRIFDTAYPFPIGDIINGPLGQKRNWRSAFQAIQDFYEQQGLSPRLKISEQCYPGGGSFFEEGSSTLSLEQNPVSKQELIKAMTEKGMDKNTVGEASLNIGAMGVPYSSYAVMAVDWFGLRYKNNDGKQRIHIVEPGNKFSFNSVLGHPLADPDPNLDDIYESTQKIMENAGYSFGPVPYPGVGFCEIATTLSKAARNTGQVAGQPLSKQELSEVFSVNVDQLNIGTGNGMGPPLGTDLSSTSYIRSYQHSQTPEPLVQYFNGISGNNSKINSPNEFVSIWITGIKSFPTDGDLEIFNNDPQRRRMFIGFTIDNSKILHVVVGFEKANQEEPSGSNKIERNKQLGLSTRIFEDRVEYNKESFAFINTSNTSNIGFLMTLGSSASLTKIKKLKKSNHR